MKKKQHGGKRQGRPKLKTSAQKQFKNYIESVNKYALSKNLDFTTAAKEYNNLNLATYNTLFGYVNPNKNLKQKALEQIAREVYNKINNIL